VNVSDEALVAGMASSDREAAAAFVRRYQGRVFGLAFAILGDRDEASDVAQEAFVRVWRHAAIFDARRGTVSTWLLTITRNLAVDAVRLRRAVPVDPVVLATLDVPAGEPLPGGDVVLPAELQRLRAAIVKLPAEQRRALLLAAYGLSAREIGERDDLPLGTVKTRIRTALLRLRSSLEVRGG
jgi:RNA polymerase sigma factor (sigma-70 family)